MTEGNTTLLVVDDDADVVYSFKRLFGKDYEIIEAFSGEEALEVTKSRDPHVVVMDVRMGGMSGVETLRKMREIAPRTVVILMTAYGTTQSTIEAMRLGAFDYVLKPFDVAQMRELLASARRVALDMRRTVGYPSSQGTELVEEEIIGLSRPMQEVYKLIGRVAESDLPVLITGESGVGKELVARAIYQHSARKENAFLAINCAAIPEQLLESELFGYERGAFTGASLPKPGKFEVCNGGTLFLDEIGEMPLSTQKKLLRVLETGDIEKIGSTRSHKVDVRVLAATNKNLEDLVAKGEFRSDLYYRLKVVEIRMPPLRERQEDIPLLVEYFVARTSRELNREKPVVTREAVELLQSHSWPGNVRELENLVKNCLVRLRGNVLHPEDVMPFLQKAPPVLSVTEQDFGKVPAESVSQTPLIFKREYIQALFDNILANQPLPEGLDAFDLIERELLEMALRYCRGNKSKAAKLLGISRNTVRKRVTKYGFDSVAEEE